MAGKQQLKPLGIIASSKSTPPPPKHQERNNNHNPQQDPTLNKIALSPSSSYSSDVIVDGVLTPMLGRMTPSALHQVFNTEIAHCMKAFTAYSKLQDPSQRTNIRRRLLVQQFRKCIDKFRPYFSAHYFTLVMVESGEKVLGLSGFHDVAKLICFQEINNINNNNNKSVGSGGTVVESINHETVAKAAELDSISSPRHHHHQRSHYSKAVSEPKNSLQCLKYRSAFGSLLCDYLNSLAGDPWIRSTQSRAIVHRVLKCLCEDMEKLINEESLASIVLDATCHVYQIVVEMGACGMWSEVRAENTW